MPANTEARTVFINAEGQYCTLGRGEIVIIDSDTRDSIARAAIPGWLATMVGSPHERPLPVLSRIEALNGAGDSDWTLGVTAFQCGHDLRNRRP